MTDLLLRTSSSLAAAAGVVAAAAVAVVVAVAAVVVVVAVVAAVAGKLLTSMTPKIFCFGWKTIKYATTAAYSLQIKQRLIGDLQKN